MVLICVSINAYCQISIFNEDGLFRQKRSVLLTGGYTYTHSGSHALEFAAKTTSLSRYDSGDGQEGMKFMAYAYLIYGSEFIFTPEVQLVSNPKAQLAPKIGIGYHLMILDANVNLILYNDRFKNYYPAIVPEVGISTWWGGFQINYGHNIYFAKTNPFDTYRHRISVRFNWFVIDEWWRGK